VQTGAPARTPALPNCATRRRILGEENRTMAKGNNARKKETKKPKKDKDKK
jgi:hypothetical protein